MAHMTLFQVGVNSRSRK